jgi:hypothetical protein
MTHNITNQPNIKTKLKMIKKLNFHKTLLYKPILIIKTKNVNDRKTLKNLSINVPTNAQDLSNERCYCSSKSTCYQCFIVLFTLSK